MLCCNARAYKCMHLACPVVVLLRERSPKIQDNGHHNHAARLRAGAAAAADQKIKSLFQGADVPYQVIYVCCGDDSSAVAEDHCIPASLLQPCNYCFADGEHLSGFST
eukprot:1161670-Pelagomonas_calceolata.AAC.3